MPSYRTSQRNARMTVTRDDIDSGPGVGVLRLYDGVPPADVNTALSGNNVLSEHDCSDPCGTVANAILTFNAIAADSSANSGSNTAPTFGRIFESGGTAVVQLTAGVGSGEIQADAGITAGQTVQIAANGTIEEGNA